MAIDGERFYWASNRTLNALRLADGSLGWSRPLTGPESGWSIALTARCVMAYPVISAHAEGELESLPLVFRRRDSGELVQRLVFPVAVSDVAVRLAPRGALVAAQGGSGRWASGPRWTPQSSPDSLKGSRLSRHVPAGPDELRYQPCPREVSA